MYTTVQVLLYMLCLWKEGQLSFLFCGKRIGELQHPAQHPAQMSSLVEAILSTSLSVPLLVGYVGY